MRLETAIKKANEIAYTLEDDEHVYVYPRIDNPRQFKILLESQCSTQVYRLIKPIYSNNGRYARLYTGE